jgi:hypothetical protein
MLNNRTVYKNNAIAYKDIRFRIRGIFTKDEDDSSQIDGVAKRVE